MLLVHYTTPTILGGVEQVMGVHAAGLHDAGADVTILAGRGAAPRKAVRIARVPEADSRHRRVERDRVALEGGERTADHDALVKGLIAKIRPHVAWADRVVVHNVMTMPLNLALTEALATLARGDEGRKFIAWTHDIAHFDPRYDGFKHPGEPWSLITQELPGFRYVTVSQERADQLAELTGCPRDSVSVVTNGVDVPAVLDLSRAGRHLAERLRLLDADPLLLLPVRVTREAISRCSSGPAAPGRTT
ncbi:MAG: hypothetical protein AUH85_12320 [Chloroflexi bacterium 13_1_40CM_4_68_4]|nr:MAG: hypothetical protein AUH85_12320 [Chloroflexi bacterium 13_1_40CM_4_68_4]